MKNLMLSVVILTFVVLPSSAFAQAQSIQPAPEQQTQATEATVPTIITVDGVPVTDETQLLKLRLMIQQAGIEEPVLQIETYTKERSPSGYNHQIDGFTTIVTTKRFVERVVGLDMRGTFWSSSPDRPNKTKVHATSAAINSSWHTAIERLVSEKAVDADSIRIGRVVIDGEVISDFLELTKLRILAADVKITEPILLIETIVRERTPDRGRHQVDGFTTIATAKKMVENISSRDMRNTAWHDDDAQAAARAKQAAVIDSWRWAFAPFRDTKFFIQ